MFSALDVPSIFILDGYSRMDFNSGLCFKDACAGKEIQWKGAISPPFFYLTAFIKLKSFRAHALYWLMIEISHFSLTFESVPESSGN